MNGNSDSFKNWSAHPAGWHPFLRWHTIWMALVLAVAAGGASQMPQAHAAPPGEQVYFNMVIGGNPKIQLRCGQTTTYGVKVEFESRGMPTPVPGPLGKLSAVNIKVEAFSRNRNVGDFTNAVNGTSTSKTTVAAGDDLSGLLVASFPFKAKNTGTTTLTFQALVQGEYLSLDLEVTVLPCKFKVQTNSHWKTSGPAVLTVEALSGEAELKATDAQGPMTGSSSVNWVASSTGVGDCSRADISIGSSNVEWTGTMDDSGLLKINAKYQTTSATFNISCGTSGTRQVKLTADPLQYAGPPEGGVSTQQQLLQAPVAVQGRVTITVIPEQGAAAFNPGNAEVNWYDFMNLFGARLTLH